MASGQAMVCTGTGEGTPPPPLPLVMQPLQTPAPGPGEVLLRVDVAGLCHSDLHILDMMFLREAAAKQAGAQAMPPLALSHEIGGTVVALGEGVDSVTVGKQVRACLPVCALHVCVCVAVLSPHSFRPVANSMCCTRGSAVAAAYSALTPPATRSCVWGAPKTME